MRRLPLFALGLITATLASIGCATPPDEAEEAPALEPWAKSFSGSTNPTSVASGKDGDLFFGGSFYSDVDFGAGTLTSEPQGSVFMAHLDADGNHLFSGATGNEDYLRSVAIGPEGDLYVAGWYDGLINFGSGKLSGDNDGYFAAFESGGLSDYSRAFTGDDQVWIDQIATTPTGDVVIAARATDRTDFGGGAVDPAYGETQLVIAAYDRDGGFRWEVRALASGYDQAFMTTDALGNIVVTSSSYDSIAMGGMTAPAGMYIAKISPDGAPLWLRSAPGYNGDIPDVEDVGMDAAGNVWIAGKHYGGFTFDGLVVSPASDTTPFLLSLSAGGDGLFARAFGVTGYAQEVRLGVAWDGEVVMGLRTSGAVDFGGGWLGDGYNYNVILGRFAKDGDHVRSQVLAGTENEYLSDIAMDPTGQPVLLGNFTGTLDIGDTQLVSDVYNTMFLARMDF